MTDKRATAQMSDAAMNPKPGDTVILRNRPKTGQGSIISGPREGQWLIQLTSGELVRTSRLDFLVKEGAHG